MTSKMTNKQIEAYIEQNLLPHKAKARFGDFGSRIVVSIWSAKDGSPIAHFASLLVDDMQAESFLKDWTGRIRTEASDMVEGRVS